MDKPRGFLTAIMTITQAPNAILESRGTQTDWGDSNPTDEIDVNRPVTSYGVGSLVTAELWSWRLRLTLASLDC